jgi:Predicted AAA-ATPase
LSNQNVAFTIMKAKILIKKILIFATNTNQLQKRLYPIGEQDFPSIISKGKVYVDKTMHAYNLISTNKYYFLSRPRRFGKSLFISTLESIFLGKKELFKNLYIYDKWEFEAYPIIRISFSNIGYRTMGLSKAISGELINIAKRYDLVIEAADEDIANIFKELIKNLALKFNKNVVILIDEYDKPLIDYLDKDNLNIALENRSTLKTFYSILKDADQYLQIVFITGVSKFSKVSIFSDLNNLMDISLSEDYNEICGISQKELESNFREELSHVDKEMVKSWYNGYRWDIKGDTVYNPFSLLNFFGNKGKFDNFWFATGTPTFLMELCKQNKFYDFDSAELTSTEMSSFDLDNLKMMPLLFQTGYLTITDYDPLFFTYKLEFPNIEVKNSYLHGLLEVYTELKDSSTSRIVKELHQSLKTENP